jgi:hypothetical protein
MVKIILIIILLSTSAFAKKRPWMPHPIKPISANLSSSWQIAARLKALSIKDYSLHKTNQLNHYQFTHKNQSLTTLWLVDHLSDVYLSIKSLKSSSSPRTEFLRQLMLDHRQNIFNFILLAPKQPTTQTNFYNYYLSLLPSILTKMDYAQAKSHLQIIKDINDLALTSKYKDSSPNDLIVTVFQQKYGQHASSKLNELLTCID